MRRLESEHLAPAGERIFDLDQRRPAARCDDQLGRIVIDDASMRSRLEAISDQLLPVEVLGPATDQAQRCLRRRRG
jgi:hypothetical protein